MPVIYETTAMTMPLQEIRNRRKTSLPPKNSSLLALLKCSFGIIFMFIECNIIYKSSVVSTSYLRLESIVHTAPMRHKNSPRRVSDNIQLNVDRGLNIVNSYCTVPCDTAFYKYKEGRAAIVTYSTVL
jgi:hypothetical protein